MMLLLPSFRGMSVGTTLVHVGRRLLLFAMLLLVLLQVNVDRIASALRPIWGGRVGSVFDHRVQAVTFLHLIRHAAAMLLNGVAQVTGCCSRRSGEQLVQTGCCTEWQFASRSRMKVAARTGVGT